MELDNSDQIEIQNKNQIEIEENSIIENTTNTIDTKSNQNSNETSQENSYDNFMFSSSKSIFVLYLIVSGNYLANLFGCRTQEALNNNMFLKHLLGFMTMYFFVVLVDSKSKWSDNPQTQLLFTFLFYFIFVITTRMDYKWWIVFIIGLCVVYVLQVYKDHDKTEEKDRKNYETYQRYLIYLIGLVIIFGFLIYYGRKRLEYGDFFDNSTFLLGKTSCSYSQNFGNNKEPIEISDYQAFMNAFPKFE
jgi:hypothetical protein